jgi:glycosyltransferase involved in cell wall biosynthesis
MSKILLVGYNPPQFLPNCKVEAAHYRSWQFLQSLLDDGHTVCLCADVLPVPPAIPEAWRPQLLYQPIPYGRFGWTKALQKVHDIFAPDCVVAVNFSHCLYATKLGIDKPVWMDIYGDILTIIQAGCYRSQSDRGMATSIAFLQCVLQTGDVYSVCGQAQKHALIGELAMSGRLNRHTFDYEFVHMILPGAASQPELRVMNGSKRALLSPLGVAEDDFVALWCGGYNTWTDVDTLFTALEAAMSQEPRLHYVSVGDRTYLGADDVYGRFLQNIDQSDYRHRFHMLGWRPWSEIATFYAESDVGVNIDALHYETIYGTRTRLLEMMVAGLPVITSLGSELSYLLRERGVALTFPIGEWRQLTDHLLTLVRQPDQRRQLARAARLTAGTELSFHNTTAALRDWVAAPEAAPDKRMTDPREKLKQLEYRSRAWLRQIIWRVAAYDK